MHISVAYWFLSPKCLSGLFHVILIIKLRRPESFRLSIYILCEFILWLTDWQDKLQNIAHIYNRTYDLVSHTDHKIFIVVNIIHIYWYLFVVNKTLHNSYFCFSMYALIFDSKYLSNLPRHCLWSTFYESSINKRHTPPCITRAYFWKHFVVIFNKYFKNWQHHIILHNLQY